MTNFQNRWMMVFVLALASMSIVVALSTTSGIDSANIENGTIQEEDLLAVDVPADGEAATYDAATGGFEWEPNASGGGVHPVNLASDVTGVLDISTNSNLTASSGAVLTGDDISTTLGTSVDSSEIVDNSVTSGDILLDTILAIDIATGGVASAEILDDSIVPNDLDFVDTPADEECVTIEGTTTFESQACGVSVAYGRFEDDTATPLLSLPIGWNPGSISTSVYIVDRMQYVPWHTPTQIGIDAVVIEVTGAATGGSLGRVCLYESDDNFVPGTLLLDTGTFAIDSVAVVTTTFTEEVVPAGNYIWAWIMDTTVTLRVIRSVSPIIGGYEASLGVFPFIKEYFLTGQAADVAGGCDDPASVPTTYIYSSTGFHIPLWMRISTP